MAWIIGPAGETEQQAEQRANTQINRSSRRGCRANAVGRDGGSSKRWHPRFRRRFLRRSRPGDMASDGPMGPPRGGAAARPIRRLARVCVPAGSVEDVGGGQRGRLRQAQGRRWRRSQCGSTAPACPVARLGRPCQLGAVGGSAPAGIRAAAEERCQATTGSVGASGGREQRRLPRPRPAWAQPMRPRWEGIVDRAGRERVNSLSAAVWGGVVRASRRRAAARAALRQTISPPASGRPHATSQEIYIPVRQAASGGGGGGDGVRCGASAGPHAAPHAAPCALLPAFFRGRGLEAPSRGKVRGSAGDGLRRRRAASGHGWSA